MDSNKNTTTIRVSKENKKALIKLAGFKIITTSKTETLDSVITDLLKFAKELKYFNVDKISLKL